MAGMKILGNAPIREVRRAADRWVADGGALPGPQRLLAQRCVMRELVLEPAPAVHAEQSDDDERHQPGDHDEELQHLVVDRSGQSAERDVDQDDEGGDHDRDTGRPTEQRLDHNRQRVEVDAGDQHASRREGEAVEQVCRLAEPPTQVLGDAVHPAAVVERHHHQREEQHRRHGADPVEVHGGDAVLRRVSRVAQHLDRAEIRRDERQPGDPARQRPSGEEEVLAGGDRSTRGEPDTDDDKEVADQQDIVERVDLEPKPGGERPHRVRRVGGCPGNPCGERHTRTIRPMILVG